MADDIAAEEIKEIEIEIERQRATRAMLVAISCISNIAYYRANWEVIENEERRLILRQNYWVLANGNFLDIAVLNWCILFTDKVSGKYGEHHWRSVIVRQQHEKWMADLCAVLELSPCEYTRKAIEVKKYRDQHVAHLDIPKKMNYPLTEFLLKSASFLHDYIKNDEKTRGCFIGYYDDSKSLYSTRESEAAKEIDLLIQKLN